MTMDRRGFLRVSAITAAGVLIPVEFGKKHARADALPAERTRTDTLPNDWITPNDEFYIQDITGGNPPEIDAAKWRLIVRGLVKKSKIVRLPDIHALEPVRVHRTLSCIGDPIGGNQISNAEWVGVRLKDVLEPAEPLPRATKVVFLCQDGYHTAIPVKDALNPDAILAYEMNGETLPKEHGYPIRLLNPGKYGQKCPKWIISVEFVEKDYLGYWEQRGWSDVASVKTATRIHFPLKEQRLNPGVYSVSGSAFDGGTGGGIAAVEVSLDGGKTWKKAEIWSSGNPLTWSLWRHEWDVRRASGGFTILARSISKNGEIQTAVPADPTPAGAEGYHTIEVTVGEGS